MSATREDWVATDLDGTLFSRQTSAGAMPGTWRTGAHGEEPSSWVPRPRHALLTCLVAQLRLVPVTARDLASFRRVRIPGVPLQDGAVLANGAILLQPGTMEPDPAWDEEIQPQLAAWEEPLQEMARQLAAASGGTVAPRLVASHTEYPAYLVAKAVEGFWGELEGLRLREVLAPFQCRVAELGRELQVLPPPVAKRLGTAAYARRYAGGRAPVLALGDMPEDLGFLQEAEFIAAPAFSTLARTWCGMFEDTPFSGSYAADDGLFLLRRMELAPVPLVEREQAIQSGQRHYSEMIGPEDAPTRGRMRLFRECLAMNGQRLAQDVVTLAAMLRESVGTGELTLVSIARAGTPIGVLLQRLIRAEPGWAGRVRHYSISVIRDRGVDAHALDWVLARHPAESIRFLDGWTGKGTIAGELAGSLVATPRFHAIPPALWVPLDISGAAGHAASVADYLLPSSLLGGTISGLVSRSILPRAEVGQARWHGCVELRHLRRYDLSRWFVQQVEGLCRGLQPQAPPVAEVGRFEAAQAFITELMAEFAVADRNRVKIGIGETVRVALRRLPERLLLRERESADAQFIARLAALRGIPILYRPAMPHAAVGLIAPVLASR